MATQKGNYDHPSYITHQMICMGVTKAGNGAIQQIGFPSTVRVRNIAAAVVTAGTTTGAASGLTIKNGTSSVGFIGLSTSAAGVVATSGDLNTTIVAGSALSFTNGVDATVVATVTAELYLDPVLGTWNAP